MNVDFLVVGLGAVGSALAFHLAQRGAQVMGLDRHHPPHEWGSSHGRTRITRLAIGEGAQYVPLVRRSHALWQELEALTGETLFRRTGLLMLSAPGAEAAAMHGQSDFFTRTVAMARRFDIAHEVLDGCDVAERFPAFLPRGDERAYHEPEAGVLFPEPCVSAHLRLAAAQGARLGLGEAVLSIEQPGGRGPVTVRTERRDIHAARVIVTAGAWVPAFAAQAIASRLAVRRQVLHWFRTGDPAAFAPERCPVFMWQHGPRDEDAMYGFPMCDGVDGVKVATEQLALRCDPDTVERRVGAEESQAMHARHVAGRLRGVAAQTVATATCLYTCSPDGAFLIDEHPDMPAVTLVSPCSGHGFKHSAAMGEALAQRALGQVPSVDLACFALARA